jgi:hypothetical protein
MVKLYPKALEGTGHHCDATVLYRRLNLHNLPLETHDIGSAPETAHPSNGIKRPESVDKITLQQSLFSYYKETSTKT